jgi:hypothetical protein
LLKELSACAYMSDPHAHVVAHQEGGKDNPNNPLMTR